MSADAQLASRHAAVLYLIEMHFTTGIQRITNWNHNLTWLGETWVGHGAVLSVSKVQESERLQYPALDIGLNIANPSQLALALGQAHTYRRREIVLYRAVLDDELRATDDPELFWAGEMDQIRLKTGDGDEDPGQVVMRCELPGKDSRYAKTLRINDAQQQARFPGDTGLSRIEQMTGQPVTWLSARFQRR